MTRPVYETEADLAREAEVARKIAQMWNIEVVKLKKFYQFDVAFIYEGEVTGFGEIKVSDHRRDKFPERMISADKVWKADVMWRNWGLPVRLFVQWEDGLFVHIIHNTERYRIAMGGRWDRGDDQDVEPCYFIPIGLFKPVVADECG